MDGLNAVQIEAVVEAVQRQMERDADMAMFCANAAVGEEWHAKRGDETAESRADEATDDAYAYAANAARLGRVVLAIEAGARLRLFGAEARS